EHAPGAIVIDRALDQRFFHGTEALGSHLLVNMSDGNPALDYEIVGIVENVKHNGLSDEPLPTLYGPMSQAPKSAVPLLATNMSLVVRGIADGEALRESVRRELRSI